MTVFNSHKDTSHSKLSVMLVVIQFLLILLIMFVGPLWPTHLATKGMMVLGGVTAIWSFLTMGLGNIRAFPEIPQQGRLVVHGPYHWIRHPMYTSVLLVTLGWMVEHPFPLRLGLWVGLVLTLWVKLQYEEQLLLVRFPSYGQYRRETKYLIPFLF